MDMETTGKVISAKKQWWLKVNTKPVRAFASDGAEFPYIIKVEYTVGGVVYTAKKWIAAGAPVPAVGSLVPVSYDADDPSSAKIVMQR